MIRRRVPLCAAAVASLLLAGCGGGSTTPPATQILQRSEAATAQVTSFHLLVDIENVPAPRTGVGITFVDGDLVVPDRLRARIAGTLAGVPLQTDLVMIGSRHFLKDPFSGAWRRVELGTSPMAFFDPVKGVLAVLRAATGVAHEGSERVGTADSYRISARVYQNAVASLLGTPSGTKSLPVELWIGKGDLLLRRLRLTGPIGPGESAKTARTVELSDFGEHVRIVAPPTGA